MYIIIIVLVAMVIRQTWVVRKNFGTLTNIEQVVKQKEEARITEINRELHQYQVERMKKLQEDIDLENARMQNEIRENGAKLENNIDYRRQLLETEYSHRSEELEKEYFELKLKQENDKKILKEEFEKEAARIEEDKNLITSTLIDLKEKQENTIKVLKEEAKENDKLNFHRISLLENDLNDIAELKKVESAIHNKDVLRKLVYKTYVETPMNELFNRTGVTNEPGIYKIENINDKKVYVGQSVNVRNRLRDHVKSAVGISTIADQAVHTAMAAEGLENFTFHLIDNCDRDKLNNREKYWIDFYKSNDWGYNRTRGGS